MSLEKGARGRAFNKAQRLIEWDDNTPRARLLQGRAILVPAPAQPRDPVRRRVISQPAAQSVASAIISLPVPGWNFGAGFRIH